ncbi:NAD(P)H-hydrate dehydratase [Evansella halocellulosilytica]|uniref:NAD(P)H-hydrate dehydratase n=1 Tax=Evansella halocellulosilytica TaxID=2011013 RepID=UPI0015CC6439|nr:NAD(P)H-hydrate dehydratase [Evansella halocellulosilytica]
MYVVTGDEMHQIDRYTMEQIGFTEEMLMENAGQAFFRYLLPSLHKHSSVIVLIGSGNNGGDGFVIARLLKEANITTNVWVIPDEERIRGTALRHKEIYEKSSYSWNVFQNARERFYEQLHHSDILIDAMLGTGINGLARDPYATIIQKVNESRRRKIISVDIPSGLPSYEGEDSFIAIEADETVSFHASKVSSFIPGMSQYYGKLTVLDIGIPKKVYDGIPVSRQVITAEKVKETLPIRNNDAHKGSSGKALIIGGSFKMTGAPALTTLACLRTGAGLVTVAAPSEVKSDLSQKLTESMFLPLESKNGEISELPINHITKEKYDGIAFGPGVGRSQSYQLFESFDQFNGPLVLDADGLFHLSLELTKWKHGRQGGPTIITPHSGEMARLMNVPIKQVNKHRFEYSKTFATTYGLYVVLKGPHTIVTTPDGHQWVNVTGNPSLAKGGTGDMLTGMIIGFLLQHQFVSEAVCNAVHIHGITADKQIEEYDVVSVTATDLIANLPKVLYSYRNHT